LSTFRPPLAAPLVISDCDSHHRRKIVIHAPYLMIMQPSISRVKSVMDFSSLLLLVAFRLVNGPNYHLSLVLASVVQGGAVNCNTPLLPLPTPMDLVRKI